MFDKATLTALQESASISQANISLEECARDVVALPSDYKLHDVEKYLKARRRARGAMVTDSLESFTSYTKTHAEEGASVFVDPAQMQAVAVLNLGTPEDAGHADNLAKLQPLKTAAYAALCQHATGQPLKQTEVAEFFEDWAEVMHFFNEAGDITPPKAIAAVRKLTIESLRKLESSEQSLSASRSAFEAVQATSVEPIPTVIYFTCQPYRDLKERQFVLRLGVLTGGDKPQINLRIVKAEQHAEEMADELAAKISESFKFGTFEGKPLPIYVGSYAKA